ncbi:MAG: hypothetical protein ACUVRA_05830 [Candidatus Bathyarchaeaceae archaeon]
MRILRRKTRVANGCTVCRQAICSSRVYCCRLKEYVDDIVYCPHFEPKPLAMEAQAR